MDASGSGIVLLLGIGANYRKASTMPRAALPIPRAPTLEQKNRHDLCPGATAELDAKRAARAGSAVPTL